MTERYGDYELLRHIATGGMAEIHLARQSGLGGVGRLMIVKRMLPQLAVRADFVAMFQDEARLTSSFQHPNIVRVYELGEQAGTYFIAMELVDGPHLGALFAHSLRALRPLPTDLCCWIVARAADGLHYAHDREDPQTGAPLHLVHRDISPQNLLVSRSGDVKVTDFGVAKATTQQTKTRTGIIKGKVAYMSPEQCLGELVDRRTDVFALGIVLYELLTRKRLFHHLKSDLLVMQKITGEDIPPPSTVRDERTGLVKNAEIDPQLDEIIRRALVREQSGRYATALEFSEALDRWIAGRVDSSTMAAWFEQHCAELAPSVQAPLPIRTGAIADLVASDRTSATPSAVGDATVPADRIRSLLSALPSSSEASASDLADATLALPGAGGAASEVPTKLQVRLPRTGSGEHHGVGAAASVGTRAGPGVAAGPTTGAVSGGATVQGAARGVDSDADLALVVRPRRAPLVAAVVVAALALVGLAVGLGRAGGEPSARDVEAPPPKPAVPVGRLRVATTPPGVPIIVDGTHVVGRSPIEVEHAPGRMSVQAQFADQPPRTVDVDVVADVVTTATVHAWVPLRVTSTPTKAKVRVDGQLRGETPFDQGFLVEPGRTLVVRVEAPGYAPWEAEQTARPGEPLVVDVKLQAAAVKVEPKSDVRAPAESGAISVRCEPWANVTLGSAKLGATPFAEVRVPAGRQLLQIANPAAGLSDSFAVTVPKDKTLVVLLRYEKAGARWTLAQKTLR